MFLPDDEILEDPCYLLRLLGGRLKVPAALTRERHKVESPALGSFGTDIPQPLLGIRYTAWKQRPHMIITSNDARGRDAGKLKGGSWQKLCRFNPCRQNHLRR